MLRLLRRLAAALFSPSPLPGYRRLALGPHAIGLLLAAAALVSSGLLPGAHSPGRPAGATTAECAVLEDFFGSPHILANFQGTPEEMQRWVDAYDRHCR